MIPSTNDLNETDSILHSLAQLIALTGTNQLPNRVDDSQANIIWNSEQARLEGQPFEVMGQLHRLVIALPTFNLQFLDEADKPVATFGAEQKTPAEASAWWQSRMHSWGFVPTKPLNYQLEVAPVALERKYVRPAGLSDWANWRTIASQELADLNKTSGRAGDIRIWPHHFDTGVYYSIPDESGKERAAIWAGFSIADGVSAEPYFYLSGYSSQYPMDFTKATRLSTGHWLARSDWQGACLPVSQVVDSGQITRFLTESYNWISREIDSI